MSDWVFVTLGPYAVLSLVMVAFYVYIRHFVCLIV